MLPLPDVEISGFGKAVLTMQVILLVSVGLLVAKGLIHVCSVVYETDSEAIYPIRYLFQL